MATRHFADISSNNANFAAGAYRRSGAVLLGNKATESNNYRNPTHHERTHAAHVQKLGVLHYHFARPDVGTPEGQADFFWDYIKHYAGPFDYLSLDYEVRRHGGGDAAWCARFSKRIRVITRSRFKIIGYTTTSMLKEMGLFHGDRVWEANWGGTPTAERLFAHQHSNGVTGQLPHSMSGIGNCDVSLLNRKTYAWLRLNAKRNHRAK